MVVETHTFTNLDKEKYVSLTTFRMNGEAVPTPMWFAENKGIIYAETGMNAGKLKRIRHTGRVMLAACTISGKVTGLEIEGKARVVNDSMEINAARTAMKKKYGLTRSIYYFILNTLSTIQHKTRVNQVYLAIESVTEANCLAYTRPGNFDQ